MHKLVHKKSGNVIGQFNSEEDARASAANHPEEVEVLAEGEELLVEDEELEEEASEESEAGGEESVEENVKVAAPKPRRKRVVKK